VRTLNPLNYRKLQPIAAYCSFWEAFPCIFAPGGTIDNDRQLATRNWRDPGGDLAVREHT
jgi:hypothetical protein